jgi:hypothetical protein
VHILCFLLTSCTNEELQKHFVSMATTASQDQDRMEAAWDEVISSWRNMIEMMRIKK